MYVVKLICIYLKPLRFGVAVPALPAAAAPSGTHPLNLRHKAQFGGWRILTGILFWFKCDLESVPAICRATDFLICMFHAPASMLTQVRGQFPERVPINPLKVLEMWDYEGSLTAQVGRSGEACNSTIYIYQSRRNTSL